MSGVYYYTARSVQGAFVHGAIQAADEASALTSLRSRALYVTGLAIPGSARGTVAACLRFGNASPAALSAFFRSFAVLIHSGVSIRRSLAVTVEQCFDRRLKESLAAVASDIENGLALSAAMARRPREFAPIYVTMIKAGEIGGILEDVLARLAAIVERERAMQKRIVAALAYPAVVGSSAVGLLLFLLTSIVPMFESVYRQMHVPLPRMTQALITVGSALRTPYAPACALALVAACSLAAARAREDGGIKSFAMRVPVLGVILRKAAMARLARMLGTLLHSGVGLVRAIDASAEAVGDASYRRTLETACRDIDCGAALSDSLARSELYEPMFVQMVRVGEETGALDAMLVSIADHYDLDVETALTALNSLIEPALILFLGAGVGLIVGAIFVPLYTLIGSIK